MGLGSENPRNKMIYLGLRSKTDKKVDPHFEVSHRVDGQTVKLPNETEVSGQLARIGHGKFEWEGREQKTISIHLLDGGREFKIEANVNSGLARNIMNTLLSVDVIGTLLIRLYVKDGFPKIYIENDGQSLGWKYKWKEDGLDQMTQKVPDPQSPGKEITIYHKLNDFLLNAWIGHEKVLNENVKTFLNVEKPKAVTAAPAAEGSLQKEFDNMPEPASDFPPGGDGPKDDSDDLPF